MPQPSHDPTGALPHVQAAWAWLAVNILPFLAAHAALIAICLGAAIAFLTVLPALYRLSVRAALFRKTRTQTAAHLEALMRRRAQLVQKDPYGRLKVERWQKEVVYFIANQVAPVLSPAEHAALPRYRDAVAAIIEQITAAAQIGQLATPDDMTPAEFESFCAQVLRQAGWDARVTQQSRDQGVDVIAEKDRLRVVLQCKLYARPVGNKAVQEASAARLHEQADFAVVVSNNRFTPAAEQLASTTGVLLIHHRDLPRLAEYLADRLAARTLP